MVLAGVALAASVAGLEAVGTLGWASTDAIPVELAVVAAALSAVALLAAALGRYDVLAPRVSGTVAAVALLGVVAAAVWAMEAAGTDVLAGNRGAVIAGVAALAGVPAAVADGLDLSTARLLGKLRASAVAVGIGAAALLVGSLIASIGAVVLGSVVEDPSFALQTTVTTSVFAVALALLTVLYVGVRDLPWSYIDLRVPGLRDVVYAVGGAIGLLGGIIVISLLFQITGVEIAESQIEQQATEGDPTFLLVLIPLSYLAIAPGEELVYRNLVQKYLYEEFSRAGAVVVGSVAFALVHFLQYYSADTLAMLSSLSVILVLSLVLAAVYERTDNLLVPIFVHGTVNAVQFAALYVRLTSGAA